MAAAGGGVRGPRGRGGSRVRLRPRGLRPHPRGLAQGPGLCRASLISVELWVAPPPRALGALAGAGLLATVVGAFTLPGLRF